MSGRQKAVGRRQKAVGTSSADPLEPALTTVYEDVRSALECGSEAERSCRLPPGKNKAVAVRRLTDTALQGASRIFMAVDVCSTCSYVMHATSFARKGTAGDSGRCLPFSGNLA